MEQHLASLFVQFICCLNSIQENSEQGGVGVLTAWQKEPPRQRSGKGDAAVRGEQERGHGLPSWRPRWALACQQGRPRRTAHLKAPLAFPTGHANTTPDTQRDRDT